MFIISLVVGESLDQRGWLHLLTYTFNIYRASESYSHSELYGHLWSLSVEEQFYLIWPFVIYFYSRGLKSLIVSLLSFYLVAKLLLMLLVSWGALDRDFVVTQLYFQTFSQADAFLYGSLVALIHKNGGQAPYKFCMSVVVAVTLFCVIGEVLAQQSLFSAMRLMSSPAMFDNNWGFGIGYTIVGFSSLALILYVLYSSSKLKAILFEGRFMVYTGKISYGLYIYHYPIIHLIERYGGEMSNSDRILGYGGGLALTYMISSVSYKYFESPILVRKSRYS